MGGIGKHCQGPEQSRVSPKLRVPELGPPVVLLSCRLCRPLRASDATSRRPSAPYDLEHRHLVVQPTPQALSHTRSPNQALTAWRVQGVRPGQA